MYTEEVAHASSYVCQRIQYTMNTICMSLKFNHFNLSTSAQLSSSTMQTPPLLKRPRPTPTFLTPVRPSKRRPIRELQTKSPVPASKSPGTTSTWSQAEIVALVEAIVTKCKGERWPTHHNMSIWHSIASFIRMKAVTPHVSAG